MLLLNSQSQIKPIQVLYLKGNSYIIAKHPEWKGGNSILVWAVNLETRYSKLYTSIQSALSELNIYLGAIKTDSGTYCIDTGVRFYSELPNLDAKGGFKQSTKQNLTNDIPKSTHKNILLNTKLQNSLEESNGNIVFISHKSLSSIVPYLNDNTIDISYLKLTLDQLKLIKEIKKIGNRKIIYLYDAIKGVILNNGNPFDSGTLAAKAIGVSGRYLLSLVDTGKFITGRYLASTNKSLLPQGKIKVNPRYKKVYAYNSDWEMLNEGLPFTNIKDAAVKLGIPYSTISLAIRNGKLCKSKYYFRNSPIDFSP